MTSIHEFFHALGNDFFHITCKQIPQGSISLDDHYYEHGFFYECSNDSSQNYYVTCKLLSRSWIINLLNNKIYGMDFDMITDLKQKEPLLSLNQKFDLERDLKKILHILKRETRIIDHGYTVSINNCQDNCENYVDVDHSQQVDFNNNRNIGNNEMITWEVSMTNNNQADRLLSEVGNYNVSNPNVSNPLQQVNPNTFPQHHGNIENNVMTSSINVNQSYNDNCLSYSRQQADLNSFSQHHIIDEEMNTENNVVTSQAASPTDIYQNYNDNCSPCIDHQDVNGVVDYTHITYPQQQHQMSESETDYNSNTNSFQDYTNIPYPQLNNFSHHHIYESRL